MIDEVEWQNMRMWWDLSSIITVFEVETQVPNNFAICLFIEHQVTRQDTQCCELVEIMFFE